MGRQKIPSVFVGALLMLGVATAAAIDTAIARILIADLHPFEMIFFRSLFGLSFVIPWLWRGGVRQFATGYPLIHIFRAVGKLAALAAFFYAVSLMALADVTAIMFSAPLFGALGAWLFLGERMRWLRFSATIAGFMGVLIVIRPDGSTLGGGALFAVGAALGLAAIGLFVKYLSKKEKSRTIVFWNLLLIMPMALAVSIPVWTWPSWSALGWLAVQGFLGFFSQLSFSKALQFGDASTLMPIDFLRLPIIAVIGYVVFAEVPGFWTWAGAAVIFCAVILLFSDERRHGRAAGLSEP